MNSLSNNLYNNSFSHIYIEEDILEHSRTKEILSRLPNVTQIVIKHYKDVFCRSKQNFILQKQSQSLILAKKEHNLLYPGAKVCQSFGNDNFFYTSCIMNCLYQCEYCYLEGMYSSAHIVVFVNLDDIFKEIRALVKEKPIYLCVSYDTDMLALEDLLGYAKAWIEFSRQTPNLTIELRTKSANFKAIRMLQPSSNVILAWTVSPKEISTRFEHKAPSMEQRIFAIQDAINCGWTVRLCLDPMITTPNWKDVYGNFIDTLFHKIPANCIQDVSIGLFRVSKDYLKRMRKQNPNSIVLSYPYILSNGVYEYEHKLGTEMIQFLLNKLTIYIDKENIFNWENNAN